MRMVTLRVKVKLRASTCYPQPIRHIQLTGGRHCWGRHLLVVDQCSQMELIRWEWSGTIDLSLRPRRMFNNKVLQAAQREEFKDSEVQLLVILHRMLRIG